MNASIKGIGLMCLMIYSFLLTLLFFYSYLSYRVVIISPDVTNIKAFNEISHVKSERSESPQNKSLDSQIAIVADANIELRLHANDIHLQLSEDNLNNYAPTDDNKVEILDIELLKTDNTNELQLAEIKLSSENQCTVHNYDFTKIELENIFNYNTYKKCKVPSNDKITIKKGKIKVSCENKKSPYFFTDFLPYQKYGGSTMVRPRWTKVPPNLDKKEFVLIKCSENAIHSLVFNRYNSKISKSANEKRKKLNSSKKPMSVLVLVFDSVSRYSFERNLPLTLKFIKSFGKSKFSSDFSVYDFEKPAVPIPFTKNNVAQIVYGKSAEEIEKVVGSQQLRMLSSSDKHVKFQKNAIWKHFSSMGYVTMFLHDTVWDYVSPLTGRDILANHVFTNFWRYLYGAYNWHDFSNSQRCAGNKNSHELSLEYTYQYFDNYHKNNKFAYVHLDAAHEKSGNIRTVDADLLRFLKRFLKMITDKGETLAFFLISDHGLKRIKNTQWDYRVYFEAMVPMTYLFLSKEIESKWNVKEILNHNQNQLISRFDINLSLKHISYFPYKIPFDEVYKKLQSYYKHPGIVSIFKEKIDSKRTCSDIGVLREYCLCNWFEKVENNKKEEKVKKNIIELIKKYFQNFHNEQYECESFSSFDVLSVYSFPLKTFEEGSDTLYRLELVTKKGYSLEVEANFCLETKILQTKKILEGIEFPYKIFNLNDLKIFIQVTKIIVDQKCIENLCEC